jgi:hypothetical protein
MVNPSGSLTGSLHSLRTEAGAALHRSPAVRENTTQTRGGTRMIATNKKDEEAYAMYAQLTVENKEKVILFVESLKAKQCTHEP